MLTQNMWSTDAEVVAEIIARTQICAFTTDNHIRIAFLPLTTTSELLYAQFD